MKNITVKEYTEIFNLLNDLTSLFGVSGNEECVNEYLKSICSSFSDEFFSDNHGNLYVCINSKEKNAKTVLIDAHTDRIGLVVSEVKENGDIKFKTAGGIDSRILPYAKAVFDAENISGIILPDSGSDSCSALNETVNSDTKENKKTVLSSDDMHIYTGYTKEELKDKIFAGTRCIIQSDLKKLCGDKVCGGAMDNRAGIAAVIESAKKLDKDKLKYNVVLLFSTEEELGLHGAYAAKNTVPDIALVVDVTHGKTSDSEDQTGVFELGSGGIICRGPNLDNKLSLSLVKTAKDKNIPYDIEVASSHSGTNAWAYQIKNDGILTGMISIPLKYMHTNVEMLSLKDINSTSDLICAALEGGLEVE